MRRAVVAIGVAALAFASGCAGRGSVCRVGGDTFTPPARVLGSGGALDAGTIGIFLEDARGSELYVALDRSRTWDVGDPEPREDADSERPVLYVVAMESADARTHPVPVGGAEERGVICLLRSFLDYEGFDTRHPRLDQRAEVVLEILERRNEQSN